LKLVYSTAIYFTLGYEPRAPYGLKEECSTSTKAPKRLPYHNMSTTRKITLKQAKEVLSELEGPITRSKARDAPGRRVKEEEALFDEEDLPVPEEGEGDDEEEEEGVYVTSDDLLLF